MTDQPANRSRAAEKAYRIGRGNWDAFDLGIETVLRAAEHWKAAIGELHRPWLCWSVDGDWSIVQQRLVRGAGWTPVVGFDPRAGRPPAIPEAVVVDFNRSLNLPVLFPHFVLEYAFAFSERLAFWHSDLLLTEAHMAAFARQFAGLEDGAMAAVADPSGWRRWIAGPKRRYWELLGCTTRGASRSQFDQGSGWWMHFSKHPNFRGRRDGKFHWEYGCGIEHWKRALGGSVSDIDGRRIAYGHFTRINRRGYVARERNNVFRNLQVDIAENYDLEACAAGLKLTHLLPANAAAHP